MSILEMRMWDSVTDDIPARVAAKAGYVAGLFPTWNEAWFKKIVADHALSIHPRRRGGRRARHRERRRGHRRRSGLPRGAQGARSQGDLLPLALGRHG